MSQRSRTGVSPYTLVYVHDGVISAEILAKSMRIAFKDDMTWEPYLEAMAMELEELYENRVDALDRLQAQKKRVARN